MLNHFAAGIVVLNIGNRSHLILAGAANQTNVQ